jgi:hypothetical protein
MKNTCQKIGDLPFELTQISKPARKHLKTLVVSLIQYHKELPARDPEVFSLKNGEDFHDNRNLFGNLSLFRE